MIQKKETKKLPKVFKSGSRQGEGGGVEVKVKDGKLKPQITTDDDKKFADLFSSALPVQCREQLQTYRGLPWFVALFVVLNIGLFLFGLVTFIVGIWLQVQIPMYFRFVSDDDRKIEFGVAMVIIGMLVMVCSVLGVWGEVRGRRTATRWPLFFYITCLSLLTIIYIATLIAFISKTKGSACDHFKVAMQRYGRADHFYSTQFVDSLQCTYNCCGLDNLYDWLENTTVLGELRNEVVDDDTPRPYLLLPNSCVPGGSSGEVSSHYEVPCYPVILARLSIVTAVTSVGCCRMAEDIFSRFSLASVTMAVLVIILHLSCIILVLYLLYCTGFGRLIYVCHVMQHEAALVPPTPSPPVAPHTPSPSHVSNEPTGWSISSLLRPLQQMGRDKQMPSKQPPAKTSMPTAGKHVKLQSSSKEGKSGKKIPGKMAVGKDGVVTGKGAVKTVIQKDSIDKKDAAKNAVGKKAVLKDSTSKKVYVKDSASKKANVKDSASKKVNVQDSASKKMERKDSAPKKVGAKEDSTPKKVAGKGSTPKKVAGKGSTPKKVESKGSTPKKVESKGSTPKKVESKGSTPKKVESKGSTPKKVESKGSTPKKVAGKGSTPKKVESKGSTQKKVESKGSTPKKVESKGGTPIKVKDSVEKKGIQMTAVVEKSKSSKKVEAKEPTAGTGMKARR